MRRAVIAISLAAIALSAYFYNGASSNYDATWNAVLSGPSAASDCGSGMASDVVVAQYCIDHALNPASPNGKMFSSSQVGVFNQAFAEMNADNTQMKDSLYAGVISFIVLFLAVFSREESREYVLRIVRRTTVRVGR